MRGDVLLTWLLLPGAMLHEVAHILVGTRFAGYTVEYDRGVPTLPIVGTRLRFYWPADAPMWAVLATHGAPLVVGMWLAPLLAYGLLAALSAGLPVAVAGWVVLNWLLFVGLSTEDVSEARRVYRQWPPSTANPS